MRSSEELKKVIKTTLLFLLTLAVLSAGFALFYLHTEYFAYQDAKERGELSGTVDTVYCGASFALRAFRPDTIDEDWGTSSYNLSSSRLTMKGRYLILAQELARNPVKTVVLEVSCDSLTRDRADEGPEGDLILLAKLDAGKRPGFALQSFALPELPLLYYDLVSKGIDDGFQLLQGRLRTGNWSSIRGYEPYHEPDQEFAADYAFYYHSNALPTEAKAENLEYLDKILELCRTHGAELVLVTTPQSKSFNCIISNLDEFDAWYRDYAQRNGLRYYNFNLHQEKDALLPDADCFYDRYHLNNEGAVRFSRLFARTMADAAAGEDVDALFFGSYAEMETALGYPG